jgi:hypothetical protein
MRAWLSPLIVLAAAAPLRAADAPPAAPPAKAAAADPVQVPYRLTETQHVMVRVKINGKGPYNFILDTGAPALFVAAKVGKAIGAPADDKGWTTFDRFELEGGLVLEKVPGRVEDLFQLKGMNGMGLAGVELHGVIGYNVLARFKIQYDFTADKLVFTPLPNFVPPGVVGMGRTGGGQPGGLEAVGSMMGFLGKMMGGEENLAPPKARGFLGVELAETDDDVTVKTVLPDSPAAQAGLKPGDKITQVAGRAVFSAGGVMKACAKAQPGADVKFTVERGGKSQELSVKFGKGL